jgi:hypothetical protein
MKAAGRIFCVFNCLLAAMISCTEVIDIDLDSTYTRIVVYGSITTDSIRHQVMLTTTSDYFSNKPSPAVSGALVELEFNGKTMQFEENDTAAGLYLAPFAFRGEPGTEYQLHISQVDVDGNGEPEVYNAASTMPGGVRLDSISLNHTETPWWSGWEVYMYALDPPTRDWYGIRVWKNSVPLTDTLISYLVFPDDFYNGGYLYYGFALAYLDDSTERERLYPGDTVTFELNQIDQSYYDFVGDAQWEIFGYNPLFSGPPANVRSNVDHGGQGIFTAYSIQRASALVPE